MNFQAIIQNYKETLTGKYFCFKGRENRIRFFQYVLAAFVITVILSIVDTIIGFRILTPLFCLATLLPSLGITARRLHDVGKSELFLLLLLIPLIGSLAVLFFCIPEGEPEKNQYGDPV